MKTCRLCGSYSIVVYNDGLSYSGECKHCGNFVSHCKDVDEVLLKL